MTTSKTGGQGSRVPTDTALIAAARRGDVDAFDSLADRHHDAAVTLARRSMNGSAEALVDAAIAAARTELRAGAGPRTAFRPYLLTILQRQNSRGLRRRARLAEPAGTAFPAACVATTAKAFQGLSEEAQVALWHTEVEGEPLLETGKLLGLEATGVAELSFAARDTLRAAQLLDHRAAISTPQCRWTTNRLNGYARNTLSDADTTKVSEHLDTCDLCAGVAPAVLAVESDLALLVATVVLGPAAEAYLGREGGRTHDGLFAGLMRDAARPVAVAISAITLITAGLLGTLAFADDDAAQKKVATPTTFSAIPVAPTSPDDESGPDSGEGSTGRDPLGSTGDAEQTVRATRTAERAETPLARPQPVQPAPAAPGSAPEQPAAPAAEEPESHSINLGVAELSITPGAGLLGLPGLSFG